MIFPPRSSVAHAALYVAAAGGSGDITTSLVGHWPLDEGTGTTTDDVAGSADGTLVNSPAWITGVVGAGALQFSGSDDYVSAYGFNEAMLPATISTWGYLPTAASVDNWQGIIFSRGTDTHGINVSNNDSEGRPGYHWNNNNWDWNSSIAFPRDKWFLLALVVESDKATLYCYSADGQFSAVNTTSHGSATINALEFGRDEFDGDLGRDWPGSLDDIRIYARALTSDDVAALYALG